MKKVFLIISIVLNNLNSSSQNLTIDELTSLRKKNLSNVEEVLTNKNWTFIKGSQANTENMNIVTFVYNKDEFSNKSESQIEFVYNNTENDKICNHRILLLFISKSKYISYINRLNKLGCKLIKSKIEDGNIVKIYQGATTTFQITTIVDNESGISKTYYQFLIIGNVDYTLYFNEDSVFDNLKNVYFEEPEE